MNDIFLNAQADRRIKRGHLWLYSNEIDVHRSPLKGLTAGQIVNVFTHSGAPLGTAYVNPQALICGRLLSRQVDAKIDRAFFVKAIERALRLRSRCFAQPYYRLVYGDADFLPGLVVDRYGDYCVVQMASAGIDQMAEPILTALEQVLKPKGIVVRNDHSARELEDLPEQCSTRGEVPEILRLEENGVPFEIPALTGQKTGWFYDHRINRQFLAPLCQGKRVLDVFCYLGSWGIQAAVAGAAQVALVDASASALEGARRNAELNGVAHKVTCHKGKAIEVLKNLLAEGEKFDVVVLDPPAFIKKRKDQKAGEAAYRHINELAIRLLEKEGLLVSASCSMPLENAVLTDLVRGAARANDRNAQLIWTGGQGPDHPIHPAIIETAYLKAQFFAISS
ncbi:MAG TPA: class I SAM-dependent rRNA methyltransferase [Cellvibrionaceae bacterium]|nr:class I SAM-dependent rRNA methyltransferase [Cellvibrionaceae bacterium]